MKDLQRFLGCGFLSVLLILACQIYGPQKEASPAKNFNKSEQARDTVAVVSGRNDGNIGIDNSQMVQAKANETTPAEVPLTSQEPSPQPQTVQTSETPVIKTPKEQAKATLEDLGHGDAWYAVEYIGFKESSWNPAAINEIGACGLFQALPCEKMNCELSDVPCQVRWATKYATQRYGTWHNAYTFWKKNNWW